MCHTFPVIDFDSVKFVAPSADDIVDSADDIVDFADDIVDSGGIITHVVHAKIHMYFH